MINLSLKSLVKGISGIIPGGISVKDFSIVADTSDITAKEIFKDLEKNQIGKMENDVIIFNSGDKLRTALYAITKGAPIEDVSEFIDWKDFESLVAEILKSKGFSIIQNFILTKPRMEIDVIGINHGIAILIDCKHWKKQSMSTLQNTVKKQIERVKHYVSKTQGAMAVPAIVTLHDEQINFIDKVPIIPITQFSSFIEEFYGNVDELKKIES